jgi:hypothetical protein
MPLFSSIDAGLLLLIAFAVVALVLYALISGRQRKRKLRRELDEQFGSHPCREYSIDSVSQYWRLRQNYLRPTTCVDDRTWDDLDMDRVFVRINNCLTSVGDKYLYARLREPSFDKDEIVGREPLIRFLAKNPALRVELQYLLARMGRSDYSGLYLFNHESAPLLLEHPALLNFLAVLPLVFAALLFVSLPLGVLGIVLSAVVNGVIHYRLDRRLALYLEAVSYLSGMLGTTRKMLDLLRSESVPLEVRESSFLKELNEGFVLLRGIRGPLSGAAYRSRFFSEAEGLIEYFQIIFLTRVRSYNRSVHFLADNIPAFQKLYRGFGEVEVALSILSLRMSLPRCAQPVFTSDSAVRATDLYHPLLKQPVLNKSEITCNSLISGSNASGKSTFIKAVALNGILAQTINTCTASYFQTRLALVVTSMAARDNILAGESYFIAEIRSLKRLIEQARQRYCLCFIDEILKGTNTVERIAASAAILRRFNSLDSLCLVATHDLELTALLEESFANYHFEEQITDEGIEFDYLLRQGPSHTRNAIKLLDALGFDEAMVKDAEALVATYEHAGHWL